MPTLPDQDRKIPHVVIVGGGFGGLYAAKHLGNKPVRVTLVDRRNFHLFQPLLYQIAIGELSPGDIATTLRATFRHDPNISVLMDEMTDLVPGMRQVQLRDEPEPLTYDYLILATGSMPSYFGHDDTWAEHATGLKSVEDALDMRRQIFSAFEAAERERDPKKQAMLLTFVIIGGGPTGVELAGALAELTHIGLKQDFRKITPEQARILLVEASSRVLSTYPEELSKKAAEALEKLGVTIRTGTTVTDIQENVVTLSWEDSKEQVQASTILWTAGVKASPMGVIISERAGLEPDRGGRVMVTSNCSVPGHPDIFVIGDLANFSHTPNGKPLPGLAAVAIQQGEYVAKLIQAKAQGKNLPPFQYQDKGILAVIGLNEAVADLGKFRFSGFLAWLVWALVHIRYLIEFDNRLMVMFQWFWTYITRRTTARLITGRQSYD
ncbi:MAG TPA: NAD(P)/FAD-dependent oxidoreductase [Coleofasciculaceae cyanobacterium]|jgi:NADH dehydrogenase